MYAELQDLNDAQCELLVGLATTMIEADGEHTGEESKALQKVDSLVGPQRFVKAAQVARERFPNRDSVLAAAAGLTDPVLRQAFFTLMLDLAQTDGLQVAEIGLLRRLSEMWRVEWTP